MFLYFKNKNKRINFLGLCCQKQELGVFKFSKAFKISKSWLEISVKESL